MNEKEIGALKEIGLFLYLIPLWGILFVVDTMMKVFKRQYKNFHITGEILSRHIEKVMDDNNLK